MLSAYDLACLSRLEEMWLDPDCGEAGWIKADEVGWNKADEEWAERGMNDEQSISQA